MSVRDWLILIGVIVVAGILVDGLRRMRKRNRISLKIDKQYQDLPDADLSAELPNGGARPAKAKHDPAPQKTASASVKSPVKQRPANQRPVKDTVKDKVESFSASRSDDDVDLLMDAEFKGVGQGAHQYLGGEQPAAAQTKTAATPASETPTPETAAGHSSREAYARSESQPSGASLSGTAADTTELESPYPDNAAVAQTAQEETSAQHRVAQGRPLSVAATDNDKARANTDDLDLNQPVTLLMEQMSRQRTDTAPSSQTPNVDVELSSDRSSELPSDAIPAFENNAPQATPSAAGADPTMEDPLTDTETLGAAADNNLHTETAAFEEAPLTAEPLAAERTVERTDTDPKNSDPRKTRKSAFTRLREEIQISFFDDLELAAESPLPENTSKGKSKAKDKSRVRKKAGSLLGRKKQQASEPHVGTEEARTPEKVVAEEEAPLLVINVTGREPLPGHLLFKLVDVCGMEFGEMDIYHRHEDGIGQGPVQFSMVNAVKPGTFDPEQGEAFSTPGVNFFLDMSEPKDLMNAFECMLATAQCICDNLNAVLKDENRSVMRPQTIEHYRQQITEYERRRLARRA